MSGDEQHEAQLRAEAVAWRDRVSLDMTSAAGIAAMNQCQASVDTVAALADLVAGYTATGEATLIEMPRGSSARAAAAFLITRGFIARIGDNLRPIRDGELI